jgi:FkbM family methyltransferase
MSGVTSAEGNVDRIVHKRFFSGESRSARVFIDVGAARPDYLSIGAYYRALGWRVIAIEPNPEFCDMHRGRGHEIYQFACGDHDEDDVDFIVVDSHGTKYENGEVSYESFSSLSIKDSYAALKSNLDKRTIKVNLRRLSTLLANQIPDVPAIEILSVDVEGWELEVLAGLDMAKHRPKVMIVENLLKEGRYRTFLNRRDYVLWRRIYPNEVYVDRRFIEPGLPTWRLTLERLRHLAALLGR